MKLALTVKELFEVLKEYTNLELKEVEIVEKQDLYEKHSIAYKNDGSKSFSYDLHESIKKTIKEELKYEKGE